MAWGETIGFALIAAGLSVAGVTVLWFMADAQDDPESIFGDVPHLSDEVKRAAARNGSGEGESLTGQRPTQKMFRTHLDGDI